VGDALVLREEQFTLFCAADISDEKRRSALEQVFFHDILNTAGTLRGAAHLLTGAEPDRAAELEDMIYDLSERLIEEIQAQLDLVAAESGGLAVHPVLLDSISFLQRIAR